MFSYLHLLLTVSPLCINSSVWFCVFRMLMSSWPRFWSRYAVCPLGCRRWQQTGAEDTPALLKIIWCSKWWTPGHARGKTRPKNISHIREVICQDVRIPVLQFFKYIRRLSLCSVTCSQIQKFEMISENFKCFGKLYEFCWDLLMLANGGLLS